MPDNFTAENVDSAGQVFATDQDAGNSVHYPIGKIAWGAPNTFNITDTANPFPAQLFGNGLSSSAPVFAVNNSAHVLWTKPVTDTANPIVVRGVGSSSVPVANSSSTPLFVHAPSSQGAAAPGNVFVVGGADSAGNVSRVVNDSANGLLVNLGSNNDVALSTASKIQVEPVTSSANRTFVDNSSAHPVFVRGLSDSTLPVSGSSTAQIGTVTNPAADSLGLTPFTASISSLATTVKNTVGRLYGWYISNPSSNTAGAYLKFYPEDSAGVTLGTSSAALDMWIPPEGAANMALPAGISMSSGISVAAAGGAGSTNHDSPPANLMVSLWYA